MTPRKFRLLDLFSGIGGFSLAASWIWGDALEIVAFCEIDPYCQEVLRKHWPVVPIIGDVKDVTKETMADTEYGGCPSTVIEYQQSANNGPVPSSTANLCGDGAEPRTIDLLTGGFPCQPFSCAGKRKGKADDRALWPEMLRVIQEIRPRWIIGENVAGIINMELDTVLSDLEGLSYETQAFVIPACAVNAPHRRDRVWIVAHSNGIGSDSGRKQNERGIQTISKGGFSNFCCNNGGQDVADAARELLNGSGKSGKGSWRESTNSGWWDSEPDVGRVAHGVPSRVDRLRALGNAIVPQVAAEIMRCIKEVEEPP